MAASVMRTAYPASWWGSRWREALPTGNGRTGAAVYGGVRRETVMLTRGDLWTKVPEADLPDISDVLPRMRELILAGRPADAQPLMTNALRDQGYTGGFPSPVPLCDLLLTTPPGPAFTRYERWLDMATGEVNVAWSEDDLRFTRSLFVSRATDVTVWRLTASEAGSVTATLTIDLHDRNDAIKPFGWGRAALPTGEETIARGTLLLYAAHNDDGSDFGAVAHVSARGGVCEGSGNALTVRHADEVLVRVLTFVGGERAAQWRALAAQLCADGGATPSAYSVDGGDYATLLAAHVQLHGELFGRVTLDLGAAEEDRALTNEALLLRAYEGTTPLAMVERMWAYGRFLLIASVVDGGLPCPLLGLWCGDYEGFWSFNMFNVNLEMIHWQALSGNTPELLRPVFDYCERLLPDFRENARRLFGCRGIHIPAVSMPYSGIARETQPHILTFTGAAGWVSQHYYDYYRFTDDVSFLAERALPFMREAARFYEDFLVEGQGGHLAVIPGNSPENTPGGFPGRAPGSSPNMQVTVSSTMDIAIVRELLSNLVEGAKLTDQYVHDVPRWEAILAKLPQYRLNPDGSLAEWVDTSFSDNHAHRHQSQLYPLFPGTEITVEKAPDLYSAAVKALELRAAGSRGHESSWGLANMASCFARTGDGENALRCLDLIGRSCVLGNFFTVHNDWRDMGIGVEDCPLAPVQIDANMGWTQAVHEMLVFSAPGVLKLLPALPAAWHVGAVAGLRCRGGYIVDIDWDLGGPRHVALTIRAEGPLEIALRLPSAPATWGILPLGVSVRRDDQDSRWLRVTLAGPGSTRLVFAS